LSKKYVKQIDNNQKTASGILVSSGVVTQSTYDDLPVETLIRDITQMRSGDCIASSSLRTMKMPLLAADITIDVYEKSAKSDEMINYLYWALDKIGYQKYKYHKLLALDYGFSLFEKVRGVGTFNNKPTNIYVKLAPIQPDTVNRWLYDGINLIGIEHIRQTPNKGSTYIKIDLADIFHYTHNSEFENPQGSAILRPARMAFVVKEKLIKAFAKTAIRGAGIPHVTYEGNFPDASKSTVEKMLRTVCIEENAYMSSQKGKYVVSLESVQGTSDILPMLDYLDKQQLFLTSSQFTTVGVNSTGSFASSQTIKTIYELSIQVVKKDYEDDENKGLIKDLIDMSPYAGILDEERPFIKLNYSGADLNQVATNMQKLSSVLNMSHDDEVWLRSMFGMPEAVELKEEPVVETPKIPDNTMLPDNQINPKNPIQPEKPIEEPLQNEMMARTLNAKEKHFELNSAIEHYVTMAEKTKNIMSEVWLKILKDIAVQIDQGYETIEIRYKAELANRLSALYREGFDRGKGDMIKEISKAVGITTLSKYHLDTDVKVNKQISKKIDNFYQKLKYSVEHDIDRLGVDKIQKRGSIEYMMGFEDSFKKDKTELTQIVDGSYNAGRDTQMSLFKEDQPDMMFEYSAIFDKNLCNECAGKDGLEYSLTEIEKGTEGVTLDKGYGVNENCLGHLGGNRCRCVWIPL
jgi:hypothetical protein